MDILILTPDAVGSTLLQRLITMYCQFQNFSRPYINIHEITNGLTKFYSQELNREILIDDPSAKYSQSLHTIIELLEHADHNIICRLAQYHLLMRQDSTNDVGNLYKFCNDNFFIIATRRKNVFEYALSQSINRITKKLNVYSPGEKIDAFADFYQSPIDINQLAFVHILNQYKKYVEWSETFFNISSYFDYTESVGNIEKYILSLPLFDKNNQVTWKDTFGIEFSDWNLCHLLTSDLDNFHASSAIEHQQSSVQLLHLFYEDRLIHEYKNVADPSWPKVETIDDYKNLPQAIVNECLHIHKLHAADTFHKNQCLIGQLSDTEVEFLKQNEQPYVNGMVCVKQMMAIGILPGALPIKKQTLAGKSKMVKNFSQCLATYNSWATDNSDICTPVDINDLESTMLAEQQQWRLPLNNMLQHTVNKHV